MYIYIFFSLSKVLLLQSLLFVCFFSFGLKYETTSTSPDTTSNKATANMKLPIGFISLRKSLHHLFFQYATIPIIILNHHIAQSRM